MFDLKNIKPATPWNVTLARLSGLQETIALGKPEAKYARWLFGRLLSDQRVMDRGQLVVPEDLVERATVACKISRPELYARVELARKHVTNPYADGAASPEPSSWRLLYTVHPCCAVYPMLEGKKLDELASDIKTSGLQRPVTLFRMPDGSRAVLEGRNRLDALELLGVEIPAEGMTALVGGTETTIFERAPDGTDPAAFVISANIHRRHLTKEQQAELIVRTMEAGDPKNDSATVARSFNPAAGKRGGSTKDPVLEKAVKEAAKHGIKKRTVQRARAKTQGKVPAPRKSKAPSKTSVSTSPTPVTPSPPRTTETKVSPSSAGTAVVPQPSPPRIDPKVQSSGAGTVATSSPPPPVPEPPLLRVRTSTLDDLGDLSAPPGSSSWARAVSLEIRQKVKALDEHGAGLHEWCGMLWQQRQQIGDDACQAVAVSLQEVCKRLDQLLHHAVEDYRAFASKAPAP